MAYLDDHRPRVQQFRPRRRTASGIIVVHTAESTPDTIGPDQGAEGVAAFIANRTTYGSYHRLCDSDGVLPLIRFDQAAYGDGTGSNDHAIHISAATQAHRWPTLSDEWIEATVANMARAAHEASDYVFGIHGVRIPARRVSRAVSDIPGEGFISHGERDPGRRTDPGPTFPWDMLFDFYSDLEAGRKVEAGDPLVKPVPTRGEAVDQALRFANRSLRALEEARGGPRRKAEIDAAEVQLREYRRALRQINIINQQEAA